MLMQQELTRLRIDQATDALNELAPILDTTLQPAASMLLACWAAGGKVLACGNGGSAAQAQHFVAELVVRYETERRALGAVALTADTAVLTATANDYGYRRVFSRQVEGLDAALGQGDFGPLLGWLRRNVHSQGSLLGFNDLMRQATGKPLDPKDFEAHLDARYLAEV
jgi:hypothetical protein